MAAVDRVEELGRQAVVLRDTLARARSAVRGALQVSDPDQLVTLRLDDELEVAGVTVARDWRDRGGLDALVAALNAAGTQAQLVVTGRWADVVNEARTAPPTTTARTGGSARSTADRPSGAAATAPSQVAEVLGPLRQQLSTAQRLRREAAPREEGPAAEVRGVSGNGRLTLVFVGEDVDRVETSTHWVEQQSPLQLGTVLAEALRDGRAEHRRRRREAPRDDHQELAAAFGRTAEAARALGRRRGWR